MTPGSFFIEVGEEIRPSRIVQGRIVVDTAGRGFMDLDQPVQEFLDAVQAENGLITLFVRHTSASLTVQENTDPDIQADLLTSLDSLAPRSDRWQHSLEGADDMPAHIKSMLSDTSIVVPVENRRLSVGLWQTIYLIEHRDRPHRREISLHYIGV